jgi:hypothetical protein
VSFFVNRHDLKVQRSHHCGFAGDSIAVAVDLNAGAIPQIKKLLLRRRSFPSTIAFPGMESCWNPWHLLLVGQQMGKLSF